MKKLASRLNVSSAFEHAITERFSDEHVMFQSERIYALAHKNEIINEVIEELNDNSLYQPRYGFYYSVPKSEIVDRYVVYLPFKELVIHYAFIQVIAEILDPQLIKNCFADRFERNQKVGRLTKKFADHSWPNYCAWQEQYAQQSDFMLITDLSSFFDNINRQILIEKLSCKLGTSVSSPFMRYFQDVVSQPVLRLTRVQGIVSEELVPRPKGIITGPSCNGVLANIYLMDIDLELSKSTDVSYGRYVDDIKLMGKNKEEMVKAFSLLQARLHTLGLSINSSKTKLYNCKDEIIELVSQEVVVGSDYHGNEEVETLREETTIIGEKLLVNVPFEKREVEFDYDVGLEDMKSAKQFCFFLQKNSQKDWQVRDIKFLAEIIKRFPSSAKHAAWLLVSGLLKCEGEVFNLTFKIVTTQLLQSHNIHEYCKARCLHHLLKHRSSTKQYLFEIQGLSEDKDFVTALIQTTKSAETTLLKVYGMEMLFILLSLKKEMTANGLLGAFIELGISLNSVETQALMQFTKDLNQSYSHSS
ncbi:RNA-directed DNA polymerase [Shewanella sp. Isolate11]|uniref:RNA-directed DNA polymerase n=1 Tax=Shewanella sp. Isolate11 TaxID=2908530 RepID=UPI001EFEC8B5|nr:RNA-directed DNA polymerase [Shewanella sp. Isolate11]MCG9698360.1 RNA-directed DNA polymerase [Shewanella sp. Isolate11]